MTMMRIKSLPCSCIDHYGRVALVNITSLSVKETNQRSDILTKHLAYLHRKLDGFLVNWKYLNEKLHEFTSLFQWSWAWHESTCTHCTRSWINVKLLTYNDFNWVNFFVRPLFNRNIVCCVQFTIQIDAIDRRDWMRLMI